MALIETADLIYLQYPLIDEDHAEFVGLLNELAQAANPEFPGLFQRLYVHTEQHFGRESQLMEQFAFPAAADHQAEHRRLLSEFVQFKSRIDRGLISFGRGFVNERLPQWLALHISGMDSALAAHIKKAG